MASLSRCCGRRGGQTLGSELNYDGIEREPAKMVASGVEPRAYRCLSLLLRIWPGEIFRLSGSWPKNERPPLRPRGDRDCRRTSPALWGLYADRRVHSFRGHGSSVLYRTPAALLLPRGEWRRCGRPFLLRVFLHHLQGWRRLERGSLHSQRELEPLGRNAVVVQYRSCDFGALGEGGVEHCNALTLAVGGHVQSVTERFLRPRELLRVEVGYEIALLHM